MDKYRVQIVLFDYFESQGRCHPAAIRLSQLVWTVLLKKIFFSTLPIDLAYTFQGLPSKFVNKDIQLDVTRSMANILSNLVKAFG